MGRIFTITRYTLILACLFLGGAGMDGGVLCVKADGQVDFELCWGNDCVASTASPVSSRNSSAANVQAADEGPCGSCLDVPLTNGRANVRHSSSRQGGSAVRLAAVPPSPTTSACAAVTPLMPVVSASPYGQSPATVVATVVLLI